MTTTCDPERIAAQADRVLQIGRETVAAYRSTHQSASGDKTTTLITPILPPPVSRPGSEFCMVPSHIALCPECGGELWVDVNAWDDDGVPDPDDILVWCACEFDSMMSDGSKIDTKVHRNHQSIWLPVTNKCALWAAVALRVVEMYDHTRRGYVVALEWSDFWRSLLEAKAHPVLPGMETEGGTLCS